MDTWVIVLIVVASSSCCALLALTLAKRSRVANVKKREQAREHLQEAQVLAARAGKEQALAEEQAARARRERAEAEERTALAEQEARERAARAGEQQAEAEQLRAQAEKLAPGMSTDTRREPRPTHRRPARRGPVPAGPGHRPVPRPARRWRHPPLSSGAVRPVYPPCGRSDPRREVSILSVPRLYGRPHVDPSIPEGRHDRPAGHRNAQGSVARPQ